MGSKILSTLILFLNKNKKLCKKNNNILTWNKPNGGYFINITTQKNCAKKIVDMHGWELKLVNNYREYEKAFVIEIIN